jgi:hypothetical protein
MWGTYLIYVWTLTDSIRGRLARMNQRKRKALRRDF